MKRAFILPIRSWRNEENIPGGTNYFDVGSGNDKVYYSADKDYTELGGDAYGKSMAEAMRRSGIKTKEEKGWFAKLKDSISGWGQGSAERSGKQKPEGTVVEDDGGTSIAVSEEEKIRHQINREFGKGDRAAQQVADISYEVGKEGSELCMPACGGGVAKLAAGAILTKGSVKLAEHELEKQVVSKVGKGLVTQETKLLRNYIRDVEKQTGRKVTGLQRSKLVEALQEKDYSKILSSVETSKHRDAFTSRVRDKLIKQWEQETGQKWPTYSETIINAEGNIVVRKGQRYDAHHFIEVERSGPHEWWNLHPAARGSEHQGGIHRSGGALKQIDANYEK